MYTNCIHFERRMIPDDHLKQRNLQSREKKKILYLSNFYIYAHVVLNIANI